MFCSKPRAASAIIRVCRSATYYRLRHRQQSVVRRHDQHMPEAKRILKTLPGRGYGKAPSRRPSSALRSSRRRRWMPAGPDAASKWRMPALCSDVARGLPKARRRDAARSNTSRAGAQLGGGDGDQRFAAGVEIDLDRASAPTAASAAEQDYRAGARACGGGQVLDHRQAPALNSRSKREAAGLGRKGNSGRRSPVSRCIDPRRTNGGRAGATIDRAAGGRRAARPPAAARRRADHRLRCPAGSGKSGDWPFHQNCGRRFLHGCAESVACSPARR